MKMKCSDGPTSSSMSWGFYTRTNIGNDHDDDGYGIVFGAILHFLTVLFASSSSSSRNSNYAAYAKSVGMGTSFLTGPALNGLSSLVVRAYCHRLIRLSATLPSLDAAKEVTCNVHGVRSEFLDPPEPKIPPPEQPELEKPCPVYFVGKVIWAKGFDQVLEVQELFRDTTGAYFPMDIYGGGEDLKAIQRAFFGRQQTNSSGDEGSSADKSSSSGGGGGTSSTNSSSHGRPPSEEQVRKLVFGSTADVSSDDKVAAQVFRQRESLRSQLLETTTTILTDNDDDVVVGVVADTESSNHGSEDAALSRETAAATKDTPAIDAMAPFDILGDLSGRTLNTGVETADAALKLIESVVDNFFVSHEERNREIDGEEQKHHRSRHPLGLVPSRARFKWRRTPIPARFLGVQDHIVVRDIPEQTIFLNMSITEVLCTTSAEALAMGKFVILPKHRKFAGCNKKISKPLVSVRSLTFFIFWSSQPPMNSFTNSLTVLRTRV